MGLLIMMLLKWRAHLRHLRQQPRGTSLLSHQTPSNTPSLYSGPNGTASPSEMAESSFSRGVVASAANFIVAANLAAMPVNGYPAPQAYKSFNTEAAGTNTSPDFGASFSPSPRLDTPNAKGIQIHSTDPAILSTLPLLPSPHEQSSFGLMDVADNTLSYHWEMQPRALPHVLPSTIHADMIAFQKELERDNEKTNQPSGSRNAEDPPPVYSSIDM